MRWLRWLILVAVLGAPGRAVAQDSTGVRATGDSVSLRFVDADLRAVIQSLSGYLPKPVLVSAVPATRVSLETPTPVSRATVRTLLRNLVESQSLDFSEDSVGFRIGPKAASPVPAPATAGRTDARPGQPPQLFVIRLKHARAPDVAATVNQLFGGGGEFSGKGGLTTGTLSDELRRQNVPPQAPGGPAPAGGSGAAAPSATIVGAVTMVPDQLSNSLLVRASAEDFDVIKAAVDQLDIRPLQVLIEVLVVEARRDRSFSLGADLFLPKQSIGGNGTVQGTSTGGGLGDLVINLMGLTKAAIDATLRTAQSKGNVEIVSRPVLLASNNVEAHILVGSQRPFVQVSRSLPTDTPTRDQVIQYRDVGTKLTVRPTINQDGYVSLVLQQEINQATGETEFDAPVISTRETATQVLVHDGQTIVLGGLRDMQQEKTSSGIPLLSGLPIIGGVFGSTSRTSTTTELYLFLTPRIIRTDEEADSLTVPRLPKDWAK